jgi:hypothetical protein
MLQSAYTQTLTKVGLKYMQDPAKFKATKIFPMCPVNLMSSTFVTYDKSYWFKNEAGIRTPATESTGSRHGRGTSAYVCQDVSHHEDVAEEYINNDPEPLNPLTSATRRVSQIISTFDEVDWATRFFISSAGWTAGTAPTTKWDVADSTPLEDIDAWKRTMEAATSMEPNKIVMGKGVFDVLKRHAQVKEQVKYTSASNVTKELLAAIFEVDEIVVLTAVYDSAAYGASASMDYIAADHFLMLHTTDSPSLESPSAGYNFAWTGYGTNGYKVKTIDQPNRGATRVEVHNYHDMRQIAGDLGTYVDIPLTSA